MKRDEFYNSIVKLFFFGPSSTTRFLSHRPFTVGITGSRRPQSQYPTLPPFFHLSLTSSKPTSAIKSCRSETLRYLELVIQASGNTRKSNEDSLGFRC